MVILVPSGIDVLSHAGNARRFNAAALYSSSNGEENTENLLIMQWTVALADGNGIKDRRDELV